MEEQFVTAIECELRHTPMKDFQDETKGNFRRIHERLDKFPLMIIGVLLTIIASLAVQIVVVTRENAKEQRKIEVIIDAQAIQNAKPQR